MDDSKDRINVEIMTKIKNIWNLRKIEKYFIRKKNNKKCK